ncbi:uncharacterized protein LOC131312758 [Rhododendron vialii]|uniref:uncharacterized protein LOC131312758 n=1 Tax=Rhododendron vialii TaxID=182163 RepID=UPI00265E35C1|nr:uncharacterized protein LOC131312758 [Rhododendron vialii]
MLGHDCVQACFLSSSYILLVNASSIPPHMFVLAFLRVCDITHPHSLRDLTNQFGSALKHSSFHKLAFPIESHCFAVHRPSHWFFGPLVLLHSDTPELQEIACVTTVSRYVSLLQASPSILNNYDLFKCFGAKSKFRRFTASTISATCRLILPAAIATLLR